MLKSYNSLFRIALSLFLVSIVLFNCNDDNDDVGEPQTICEINEIEFDPNILLNGEVAGVSRLRLLRSEPDADGIMIYTFEMDLFANNDCDGFYKIDFSIPIPEGGDLRSENYLFDGAQDSPIGNFSLETASTGNAFDTPFVSGTLRAFNTFDENYTIDLNARGENGESLILSAFLMFG